MGQQGLCMAVASKAPAVGEDIQVDWTYLPQFELSIKLSTTNYDVA